MRDQAASGSQSGLPNAGEMTPPTERSISGAYPHREYPSSINQGAGSIPHSRSPVVRNSNELSRQSSRRSRTPSRAPSPSYRPTSAGTYVQSDEYTYNGRSSQAMLDESVFYQAETQNLTRENQMLRQRIRELGRHLPSASSNISDYV